MNKQLLSVEQKVQILVESLDGSSVVNEALSSCLDSDAMLDILIGKSSGLGLDLTKDELLSTPPIRDWIWWKNKEAPLTLGDGLLRYQQDKNSQNRRYIGMGALIILLFVVGIICGF